MPRTNKTTINFLIASNASHPSLHFLKKQRKTSYSILTLTLILEVVFHDW